jgi:hypothetical protein
VVVEVIPDETSVLTSGVETAFVGMDARSEQLLEFDGDVADVVVATVQTEEGQFAKGRGAGRSVRLTRSYPNPRR